MGSWIRPTLAVAALFVVGCSQSKPVPAPPLPPVIESFAASKTHVSPGDAVTLTYKVTGATSLVVLDETGATVASPPDIATGGVVVNPVHTSFYVLRATGDGGKDSAFVQVAVNETLKEVFLIAVPPEVDPGQSATLLWSAVHGTNVKLSDDSGAKLSTDETGTLEVTPTRTTSYTLTATGQGGALTQTATVTVHPVIDSFTADPAAAKPGGTITLHWVTGGADQVVLAEDHFGELYRTTTDVATGSFDFTVPGTFPVDGGDPDAGLTVPTEYPLHFSLTASTATPPQSVSRGLDSITDDGPVIHTFAAPAFATQGDLVKLSWQVSAYRVQLLLDGQVVYESVPPASANGSFSLPPLAADATATLVAFDYHGLSVSKTANIKLVAPPKVTSFTVPASGTIGSPVTVSWTTTDATRVVIRERKGPTLFTTSTTNQVASGNTSLTPTRDTTWVIEAYDAANDLDSKEASIAASGTLTTAVSPDPTAPNTAVTLSWDVTLLSPTEVLGIPQEPPTVQPGSTGFIDLDGDPLATVLYLADPAEGTQSFTAPLGYAFPFAGQTISSFTAGVNGFLAFGTSAPGLKDNADLHGTTGLPPPIVAPFWDDLDLGATGRVLWKVAGDEFPRVLIVQWDKLNLAGDAASTLTFQAQLEETGVVHFLYHTLDDANGVALGSSATVGIYAGPGFAFQSSYDTAALTAGDEQTWFTGGPLAGSVVVAVGSQSFTPGFFYRTASSAYVYVSAPVRVFKAGSVVVNEVMPYPASAAVAGQWAELYNPSSDPLDISGLQLEPLVTPMPPYLFPPGSQLPGHGYLVLGQSTDVTENDGAGVSVAWGGVALAANNDALRLVVPLDEADGGTPYVVSSLAWTTPTQGTTVQVEPVLGTLTCTRDAGYGQLGQIGTPGLQNQSCFGYTLSSVPVDFEDVSVTGTPLFAAAWDDSYLTFALSQPFTYFGMAQSSLTVSTNGWVGFGTYTSSSLSNKTAPSTSSPVGTIAPFWDDLKANAAAGTSNVFAQRVGDHQIFQWAHAMHYGANDDLNFELKLFDDGRIEVHYASMTSGSSSHYADGNSATVWIEDPTGAAALPASVNQPTVQPQTAWRFTPSP